METLVIHPVKFRKTNFSATHILYEKDFDEPLYLYKVLSKFNPESFDEIYIEHCLELSNNVRYILRTIDTLLKVGGKLYINYYSVSLDSPRRGVYPLSYIKKEVSLRFGSRINLFSEVKINNSRKFILGYEKIKSPLLDVDNLESWTIGIMSGGKNDSKITKCINNIKSLGIPNLQIIVCGKYRTAKDSDVLLLDDSELYRDIRIPISSKKNKVIEFAKYNNIALIHDRITFSRDWLKSFLLTKNYFDFVSCPIISVSDKSLRVNDWCVYPSSELSFFYWPSYMSYKSRDKRIYMNGGLLIGKREYFKKVKFNEELFWGEQEDVDFSQRLRQNGYTLDMLETAKVYSTTERIITRQTISTGGFHLRIIVNYIAFIRRKVIDRLMYYRYIWLQ